jgi:hypothetical protein
MINRKEIKKSIDALAEIESELKESFAKDGLQSEDFSGPVAAIIKNGEVIYKTFNPLQNGAYLGDEKLQLDWNIDPLSTDFNVSMTQRFKDDDVKLIFSVDGNIINVLESKPGDSNLKAKLQLKIQL